MSIWKNPRIIILAVCLVLAIAAINPRPWQHGATIRSVEKESAASLAGFIAPEARSVPVLRERVTAINGQEVRDELDYLRLTQGLPANVTVSVTTNKQTYSMVTQPIVNVTVLPETERVTQTREVYNDTTKTFETITSTVVQNKTIVTVLGTEPLGLGVYTSPTTNIRLGLDLSGGARVLLEPEKNADGTPIDDATMSIVIETIKQRLNVFGLADVVVRPVSDLSGNQFILVEIAGASERDVRDLVLTQGKFEARIANRTVMRGGSDITYVCRDPQCSGLSPRGCGSTPQGASCQFQFSMTMTPEAAERQANATRALTVVPGQGGESYLSEPLELYLDDELVNSLLIGSSLRGSATTQIAISGAGSGATIKEAEKDALYNMKQLQTVLITGSLPVKLHVVKTDTISSELGDEFINNSLLVSALAFLAVTITMMVRYRNPRISIPVIVTLVGEVVITLGIAAAIGSNIDLAAIAGLLIAIGTGVDDQIVIADETLSKHGSEKTNWRDRLNKAFFIIFTAYFTAVASMLPLLFAGAGLVKGFAITSIIGVTIGVLITRPAFAVIMEELEQGHEKP